MRKIGIVFIMTVMLFSVACGKTKITLSDCDAIQVTNLISGIEYTLSEEDSQIVFECLDDLEIKGEEAPASDNEIKVVVNDATLYVCSVDDGMIWNEQGWAELSDEACDTFFDVLRNNNIV